MSYATTNGMRSARYPLEGCGCGIGGCGCVGFGAAEAPQKILSIAAVGLTGIGLLWFMGRGKVNPNRRRRRIRRRRR